MLIKIISYIQIFGDTYKKRVKKLLGYSYKTARKTFTTYALELQVSATIRRILIGHQDQSVLSHYDNLSTKVVMEQVEQAHTSILERFKASELTQLLMDKLEDIKAPELLYNGTIIGGTLKHFLRQIKKI